VFKIALTAGHYMGTYGKRCKKSLDPNETREWWLNDRIADKVEKLLRGYTGYELIRTDDTTGQQDISLTARVNAANNFKADFYLSIHHNAGVGGGSGGGIMAYIYNKASAASAEWQKSLYDALIDATGLKGNRSCPLAKSNLFECRETKMPAVLLELGFMDSSTDVPVILSDKFADQCAAAIVGVLVERGKLKKKEATHPAPDENKLYWVKVGPYAVREKAEKMLSKLQNDGYDEFIVE
jgi:N-acetylmuramoyl-L-alanine amidase